MAHYSAPKSVWILEQLQLSLLGTTSASPLDLIRQICAFVWPPPVRWVGGPADQVFN